MVRRLLSEKNEPQEFAAEFESMRRECPHLGMHRNFLLPSKKTKHQMHTRVQRPCNAAHNMHRREISRSHVYIREVIIRGPCSKKNELPLAPQYTAAPCTRNRDRLESLNTHENARRDTRSFLFANRIFQGHILPRAPKLQQAMNVGSPPPCRLVCMGSESIKTSLGPIS